MDSLNSLLASLAIQERREAAKKRAVLVDNEDDGMKIYRAKKNIC